MKEFAALFKNSVEGTFDEFSALFARQMKLLLGNVSRFEEMDERRLDGLLRELGDSEAITILEREVGDKAQDLLLLPLNLGHGRIRYIVAEGSLRHTDLDHLHLLKWLYETRADSDQRMRDFRKIAVYDCDRGVLSRHAIPSVFEIEKSRCEEFGSSMAFLILKIRQDELAAALSLVRKNMRRTDYLFGLSGGEIMILLVECSAHGGEAIMQRMKKVTGAKLLSAGYSIYPEQGETVDDLLSEAQGALV